MRKPRLALGKGAAKRAGGESGPAFVDWQKKRKHAVYLPSLGKVHRVPDGEVEEFLKSKGVQEVYLESAPRRRLYDLLDAGFKVFTLRRRNQRSERETRGLRKSDENDARLLYLIWQERPEAFQEYHRRALDVLVKGDPTLSDEELQRYRKVSEKLAQIRRELHEWPDDEALKLRIRNLSREEARLKYQLNRKYGNLFAKFSDIKGCRGPTLLLLLSETPDLQSFQRFTSLLVYLGLRAVYGNHRNFNKKARQYLWLLARQVRKNNAERKKQETIWQTMRWLAAEVYRRLGRG